MVIAILDDYNWIHQAQQRDAARPTLTYNSSIIWYRSGNQLVRGVFEWIELELSTVLDPYTAKHCTMLYMH